MDIAVIKQMAGITSDKHDAYIEAMVPVIIEQAKDYCNNTFLDAQDFDELPGGVKLYVAQSLVFGMNTPGLQSRKMGTVSYTYTQDEPASIKRHLRPYKKVSFK